MSWSLYSSTKPTKKKGIETDTYILIRERFTLKHSPTPVHDSTQFSRSWGRVLSRSSKSFHTNSFPHSFLPSRPLHPQSSFPTFRWVRCVVVLSLPSPPPRGGPGPFISDLWDGKRSYTCGPSNPPSKKKKKIWKGSRRHLTLFRLSSVLGPRFLFDGVHRIVPRGRPVSSRWV